MGRRKSVALAADGTAQVSDGAALPRPPLVRRIPGANPAVMIYGGENDLSTEALWYSIQLRGVEFYTVCRGGV